MKMLLAATAVLVAMPVAAEAQSSRRTKTTTTTNGGYTAVTVRQDAPYIAYSDMPPPPPPHYDPYIDYAPVPLDVNVFDGLRIEGQVGFDRLRDVNDGAVFTADDGGRNGVSYGGELGFDIALGSSAVIGAYGGFEGSSIKDCVAVTTTSLCFKPQRTFTAGARLGFVVSPAVLLYAKGGYSQTRLKLDATDPTTAANNFTFSGDLDGFHVGGGIEAAFGRHAYGKIEYVYTRLGNLRFDDGDDDGSDEKFDRHQVKAGLGIRL